MLRFHPQISQEVAESYAVFPVKEPTEVCMVELKRCFFVYAMMIFHKEKWVLFTSVCISG